MGSVNEKRKRRNIRKGTFVNDRHDENKTIWFWFILAFFLNKCCLEGLSKNTCLTKNEGFICGL